VSDLTTFRDHCRRMAKATTVTPVRLDGKLVSFTPAERIFWTRLADEIDDWIAHGLTEHDPEDHTEPLWETT
jgi:hypothetical protein